jgi:hypothetical protein
MAKSLKQVLLNGRGYWDTDATRPAARENFGRVVRCQTAVLGAEIYGNDAEQKLVFHSCKSRACSSCGHRATQLWQGQQWRRLPDISYTGLVFTMPDVLWPIFQQNRNLLHDLPALGAAVIEQWTEIKFGARVLIMVVAHTFGGFLNFNPHLHILVSNEGLDVLGSRWISSVKFPEQALMPMWRWTVITYLRQAMRKRLIHSKLSDSEMAKLLKTEYERWWKIDVEQRMTKAGFLRYAARYVRRPPVAQYRLRILDRDHVAYQAKDTRQHRRTTVYFTTEEFIGRLTEHVPDRYRHAIRYFGLLAPRLASGLSGAFTLLGQQERPPVARLPWAESIQKTYGRDPLIDSRGNRMHWIGRLSPDS